MTLTFQKIRNNPLNKTFFNNASLFDDTGYAVNANRGELTVTSVVPELGRNKAVWKVDTDGVITDRISFNWF